MKKSISSLLIFMTLSIQTMAIQLPNGKSVSVRLTETITSDHAPSQVQAIIERDVKDPATDCILIRRGTPVSVTCTKQKARGVGKPGHLHLQCLSTQAVDGQTITLQGSLATTGEPRKGLALGLGLGLGLWVWPAIFCLCIKGEQASIPADTLLSNIVVNDDYEIAIQ